MSADTYHQLTHHRPAPIREVVVLRCKTSVYGLPPQQKVMGTHFDMGHLSHVIVRQIGLVVMSIGSATTQIPIDCADSNAHR